MWLISTLAILLGILLLAFGAPSPGVFEFRWPVDGTTGTQAAYLGLGPALLGFGFGVALCAPQGANRNGAALVAFIGGLAVAIVVAAKREEWAVRAALAAVSAALMTFALRRDIAAVWRDPRLLTRRPASAAVLVPALLFLPTLAGDPAAARHALALCLGAAALLIAGFVVAESRAGQPFDFETWNGGLGGGRGGFSLSRPLAMTLLALGLAGAAAAAAVGPPPEEKKPPACDAKTAKNCKPAEEAK